MSEEIEPPSPAPAKPQLFGGLLDAFKDPGPVVLPKPEQFTFRADFNEALDDTDPFTLLLRGHVWIERALHDSILANGIRRPDQYEEMKLGFYRTVRLASALGVLHPSSIPAFDALNALRNNIAHDARFSLDESIIRDFVNAAMPKIRKIVEQAKVKAYKEHGVTYNPRALITRFKNALRTLEMIADHGRIRAEERRKKQTEDAERIGELLAKIVKKDAPEHSDPES